MMRDDFIGTAPFTREIDDQMAQQVLRVEGEARWRAGAGPDELIYSETGLLQIPGKPPLRAERTYLWRFDGADVAVFFEDGRAFHEFVAEGAGAGSAHLCGEDLYRVQYDFRAWPEFRATWRVKGPRKTYESRTIYRKVL